MSAYTYIAICPAIVVSRVQRVKCEPLTEDHMLAILLLFVLESMCFKNSELATLFQTLVGKLLVGSVLEVH